MLRLQAFPAHENRVEQDDGGRLAIIDKGHGAGQQAQQLVAMVFRVCQRLPLLFQKIILAQLGGEGHACAPSDAHLSVAVRLAAQLTGLSAAGTHAILRRMAANDGAPCALKERGGPCLVPGDGVPSPIRDPVGDPWCVVVRQALANAVRGSPCTWFAEDLE